MEYALLTFLAYSLFVSGALYFVSGRMALKAAVVAGLFICVGVAWWSYEKVGGWPTKEYPTSGKVVSIIVDEPNAIYLWVVNEKGLRSHQIPYTEGGAKDAIEALMALERGGKVELKEPPQGTVEPQEGPEYEVTAPQPLMK